MALRQPDRSLRSLINLTILSAEISAVVLLIPLLQAHSIQKKGWTSTVHQSRPEARPDTPHPVGQMVPRIAHPSRKRGGLHPSDLPNLHPDASEVHPSQVFMARTAR